MQKISLGYKSKLPDSDCKSCHVVHDVDLGIQDLTIKSIWTKPPVGSKKNRIL